MSRSLKKYYFRHSINFYVIMKNFFLFFTILIAFGCAFGQKIPISGRLQDDLTKSAVPYAKIILKGQMRRDNYWKHDGNSC